ncbi:MAG: CBS domain-containing protein [Candidatus Bathyarchaeia archaeon]
MERGEVVVKVRDLMTENIVSVDAEETVIQAARLMSEKELSSVLVKRQGELTGIITDRDIITKVVSKGSDPTKVRIGEVMPLH